MNGMREIFLLFFLIHISISYLQFSLTRIPKQNSLENSAHFQCMNDIPQQESDKNKNDDEDSEEQSKVSESGNYKEVCYEKDISYAIQLFNKENEKFLISMDTTTPLSWLKGNKCHSGSSRKKCEKAQPTLTSKVQNILSFSKRKSTKKSGSEEIALIKGSTEVVKGVMEKTKDLTFSTRDVGRLARMKDILMIGLGLMDENHEIELKNTNFINATRISPNLNKLCDGAVSLRFDQNSETSFLQEMIDVSQSNSREKYVTIFSGEESAIMIGDISIKHSREGISGISWIQTKVSDDHEDFGRLPYLKSFILTEPGTQTSKQISASLPTVFTISSSSIHIPENQLNKIIEKFLTTKQTKGCKINEETRYVECEKVDKSKQINFSFEQEDIAIPLESLILSEKHKKIKLNIKKALDNQFLILGEPVFRRYLIILDYVTNKIGVTLQSEKPFKQIINVVSLLHVVVWSLIIMCCVVLLTNPWERCKKVMSERPVGLHYEYPYPYVKKKKYSPLDEQISEDRKTDDKI